jgi:DNA-binding SARP family transcriptional activator/tetratricopeptide (TPR) repeat protein
MPRFRYAPGVQFRLLGSVEMAVGERVFTVPRPRSRAVLAYLLLSANRLVTTESIVDALWGQSPPATARNQIQADVSAVRRSLREAGGADCLKTSSSGYRIEAERDEIDLSVFADLLAQARTLADRGEPAAAAQLIRQALRLWRGPALGEVTAAFVESARSTLEEQRLGAFETLAELDLAQGRHEDVAVMLGGLVHEHPMREGVARSLAVALYRSGRTGDALAVLRTVRDSLAEEFGVDPAAATTALEVAILRSDPALDLGQPIVRRNSLPATASAFAGRSRYLEMLDSPASMLVTITGSGGIGKTALALHWARTAEGRFPDGILYVDLRGFARARPLTPVEGLSRLLYQLGVAPEQIPASEDYATDLYRAQVAGKRLLIVIDNARNSEQARPMLPGSPSCQTLVTSRTELSGLVARDGAWPIRLGVLEPAEAHQLLEDILGGDPMLGELAELCAYVPLALRIAAASLVGEPRRSIRDYVTRLRSADRLGALELDGDDHVAIAGAFELSYTVLDPAAQQLFRLLSLVPGPDFTVGTAADLIGLGPDRTARLLNSLVAAHLVEERTDRRLGFHDLLRLYAANLAAAAEDPAAVAFAVERLYGHYLRVAQAAAKVLYPQVLRLPTPESAHPATVFDDHSAAAAWLDAERPNLVAATTAGAEHAQAIAAWRLADCLRGYFYLRMFTVDWHTAAHAALAAAEAHEDRQAQAAALLSLADLHWRQGDYDRAEGVYALAIDDASQAAWLEGEATALGNLGGLRRMQGRMTEAADLLERSLALNVQTGRLEGQSVNLGNLSIVYAEIGDYTRAEEHLRHAYELFHKIDSRTGEAAVLSNLGEFILLRGGDPEAAEGYLHRALQLHRELGDRAGEASTKRSLAEAHRGRGDLPGALAEAKSAAALAEESGDQRVLANCLRAVAELLVLAGNAAAALAPGMRSVSLAQQANHRYVATRALIGLARVHIGLDDGPAAHEAARQALDLANNAGYSGLAEEAEALSRTATRPMSS